MQNKQLKVFLIILNWNGWKMTVDCLESLEKINSGGLKVEVVVVDNGSTDNSVEEFKKLRIANCELRILENKVNYGFAEGNNVGIKYALENGAEYVCLLNNDTRVDPDFLVELIKTAELEGKIGIVGGKIYFEKRFEFHKEIYRESDLGKVIWYAGGKIDWENVYATHQGVDEVDVGQYETEVETEYVNGCLMLIKRRVIERVGFFDKRYFLYFEDVDFSIKAKKAGFKLLYCPASKIWHLNSGSSGSGSGLHDYFTTRNRMLFGLKFAPLRSKIALLLESVKLLKNGREWQKRGIKDFYLLKFGMGSWGK